jgi:hypothetical protein
MIMILTQKEMTHRQNGFKVLQHSPFPITEAMMREVRVEWMRKE